MILLGTIWTFNMFPIVYLMLGEANAMHSEILVTYAYRLAFGSVRDYAGAATYGILILSMLLVFAVFHRRVTDRREAVR